MSAKQPRSQRWTLKMMLPQWRQKSQVQGPRWVTLARFSSTCGLPSQCLVGSPLLSTPQTEWDIRLGGCSIYGLLIFHMTCVGRTEIWHSATVYAWRMLRMLWWCFDQQPSTSVHQTFQKIHVCTYWYFAETPNIVSYSINLLPSYGKYVNQHKQ